MAFLTFNGITKRFPGVLALDQVSFGIERGSCHALVGENGAGKSTLGKILAGVYVADAGQILLDGQPVQATTPLAARKLGIAMVHQELAFCPNLTIAENLCLGDLPHTAGWLDRRRMRELARSMLDEIEADLDVDTFQTMVDAAAAGHGRRSDAAGRRFDVVVGEVYGDIATATVHAVPYIDYLHLVRTPDGWRIVNALWCPTQTT